MMRAALIVCCGARALGRSGRGVLAVALVLAGAWAGPARGQAGGGCPLGWDPGIGTPGAGGFVRALAALPGGDVIAGGDFTTAGGVSASRVARCNPSTGVWSALGSGTSGSVYALAVLPGGEVLAGGTFTTAGGAAASNIARYNPTTGVWSPLGAGTNGLVIALVVLPGGDVLVGGQFTSAGGVADRNNIARYNPTTGAWSGLGPGTNAIVFTGAVLPGGDVIVGGAFSTAGAVSASRLARLNPTTGVWSALVGGGTNLDVFTLAVLPGGDVIVGGSFTAAGPIPADRIARYSPGSGVWSDLRCPGGTDNSVFRLAVLPDGDVMVGGLFTTAGGAPASRIARCSPTAGGGVVWSAVGAGVNAGVRALAVLPDGGVIAGGDFTTAGGAAASRVARVTRGANPPSIVAQPLPVVTALSGTALFHVAANPGLGNSNAPTFQWRRDGVTISADGNPSAATPVLSLSNVQAADVGSYDCVVTDSCGGTGTVSRAATLTLAADACPTDFNADGFIDFFDYVDFVAAFQTGC